eukprot:m.99469 g.99469  ORF g.99469 m.99469 type:complete len:736 (+) comp13142_c1_seq6:1603-3810(+)
MLHFALLKGHIHALRLHRMAVISLWTVHNALCLVQENAVTDQAVGNELPTFSPRLLYPLVFQTRLVTLLLDNLTKQPLASIGDAIELPALLVILQFWHSAPQLLPMLMRDMSRLPAGHRFELGQLRELIAHGFTYLSQALTSALVQYSQTNSTERTADSAMSTSQAVEGHTIDGPVEGEDEDEDALKPRRRRRSFVYDEDSDDGTSSDESELSDVSDEQHEQDHDDDGVNDEVHQVVQHVSSTVSQHAHAADDCEGSFAGSDGESKPLELDFSLDELSTLTRFHVLAEDRWGRGILPLMQPPWRLNRADSKKLLRHELGNPSQPNPSHDHGEALCPFPTHVARLVRAAVLACFIANTVPSLVIRVDGQSAKNLPMFANPQPSTKATVEAEIVVPLHRQDESGAVSSDLQGDPVCVAYDASNPDTAVGDGGEGDDELLAALAWAGTTSEASLKTDQAAATHAAITSVGETELEVGHVKAPEYELLPDGTLAVVDAANEGEATQPIDQKADTDPVENDLTKILQQHSELQSGIASKAQMATAIDLARTEMTSICRERQLIVPQYVVPDTNCFLEEDSFDVLQTLASTPELNISLAIPTPVIQELDGIKLSTDTARLQVAEFARRSRLAIQTWLDTPGLSVKHVRAMFKGGKRYAFPPKDLSNDDAILHDTKQLSERYDTQLEQEKANGEMEMVRVRRAVLLTNDRNLLVRAQAAGTPAVSCTQIERLLSSKQQFIRM